jgi:hypothetical protein
LYAIDFESNAVVEIEYTTTEKKIESLKKNQLCDISAHGIIKSKNQVEYIVIWTKAYFYLIIMEEAPRIKEIYVGEYDNGLVAWAACNFHLIVWGSSLKILVYDIENECNPKEFDINSHEMSIYDFLYYSFATPNETKGRLFMCFDGYRIYMLRFSMNYLDFQLRIIYYHSFSGRFRYHGSGQCMQDLRVDLNNQFEPEIEDQFIEKVKNAVHASEIFEFSEGRILVKLGKDKTYFIDTTVFNHYQNENLPTKYFTIHSKTVTVTPRFRLKIQPDIKEKKLIPYILHENKNKKAKSEERIFEVPNKEIGDFEIENEEEEKIKTRNELIKEFLNSNKKSATGRKQNKKLRESLNEKKNSWKNKQNDFEF